MALRDDRRHRVAREPTAAARSTAGFTAADIGRSLSRERTRQGLSLHDVCARTGIPLDQLRAAETGVLDRPDGLATLKTVRRYADLLGLPGDRYALAILERWPTNGNVPPPFSMGVATAPPALGPLPIGGPGGGPGGGPTGPATAQLGALPADSGRAHWVDDGPAFSATGMTPAVLAPSDQVWRRRRRRPPAGLQALVVVVTLAVLASIVLLAVDRVKPAWLRAVGIAANSTAASASPPRNGASRRSGTTASAVTLRPRTTSATSTEFNVTASTFTVTLSASGGPCWVQVTSATAASPLYAGVVQPGSPRRFHAARSMVVEMGSTSGRLSISSKNGRIATYAPPEAPYQITVHSHR